MEKTNKIIYENIISDFKQRLISEEKKLSILNYIKFNNNLSQKFYNDITLIIEDYNVIITQAIQSIKSLLSENEKMYDFYYREKKHKNKQQENNILKYNYFNKSNYNYYNNNNNNINNNNNNIYNDLNNSNYLYHTPANQTLDYSSITNSQNINNISHMSNLTNISLKTPIREQLRFKIRNKNPKKFTLKRNKINKFSENNEKVKLTNEILKNLNFINNNKNFFIDKYTNSEYLNDDEKYKDFLYNLIEYKFDMNILIDILRDINGKEKEFVKYISPYN